jgi:hypothetical protein
LPLLRFKEEEDLTYDVAKPNPEDWSEYLQYDPDFQQEFGNIVNDPGISEANKDFTPDVFDNTYLNMELVIPRDSDGPELARVTKHLKDKDGLPIGRANNNPVLDTRMCEVEYPYGHKASLAANTIAENMFAQVGDEGNRHVLFEKIIDHRTDGTEVKQQDAFLKNGSTAWVSMKDIKGSYPVQLA